jgi:hypothetical protein
MKIQTDCFAEFSINPLKMWAIERRLFNQFIILNSLCVTVDTFSAYSCYKQIHLIDRMKRSGFFLDKSLQRLICSVQNKETSSAKSSSLSMITHKKWIGNMCISYTFFTSSAIYHIKLNLSIFLFLKYIKNLFFVFY